MRFRHEYKYCINQMDLILLRNKLSIVASLDEHCKDNGYYYIKSLYFDNYMDKALREKLDGVDKREKFRIRYYDEDTSFIRLEKKSKINGLCLKESVQITKEECQKIIDGDIDFMIKSDKPLLQELYAKMHYQLLRPKCIVAYNRESFIYPAGNVRVTLDQNIEGSYNVQSFLTSNVSMTKLYNNFILEVKWDEYLPEVIKNIVQLKNRNLSAFSKYKSIRLF